MAHFAEVNSYGLVLRVVVIDNNDVNANGGGGAGGVGGSPIGGTAGTANTGGGGGGASFPGPSLSGGAGGSGIVIIRAPGSAGISASPGTNTVTTLPAPAGGCKVATFTVSGTLVAE